MVIWILDLDLRLTYISPYVRTVMGYTPDEFFELPGERMMTPSSIETCMQVFAEEMKAEERADRDLSRSRTIEVEHIHRDGHVINAELIMTFIRDGAGNAVSILGVTRDITERRIALEAVKRNEELYKAIFENTGNASVIFGEDTVIQLANSRFEELSGYSKEELEGRMSWTAFIAPEDMERMRGYHLARRSDGRAAPDTYEFRALRRNGEMTDVFMTIALIPGTTVSIASLMDITNRRRMEMALRQSEAKYRFLTEHLNDVVWTCDLELNNTYVSPSVEKILGYSPEDPILRRNENLLTPESYAGALDLLSRELARDGSVAVDPRRTITFMAEYRHKNGSTVWIENVIGGIRDDGGGLIGIHGVSRDVTGRKLAEERIRRSEERYRTIFESTATANIITDEDALIVLANTNFAAITGYSREELEGRKHWTELVNGEDIEKMRRYHRLRRKDPAAAPSSYEIRIIHRSGEERTLYMSTAIIPETDESVASMIDITDWKRSEKARTESEERFRELAELLPETVYEADREGHFTFINQTGLEKLGYSPAEFIRKKTVFDVVVPDDHDRMVAVYLKIIHGERIGLGEYTARKKDGTLFPALVYATGIFRDGRTMGHRGFVIDISDKKNLEDQLAKAQKMEAIGTWPEA